MCGSHLSVLKNECLKFAKRVVLTKYDLESFKGHLHVDMKHVQVTSSIHESEEIKGSFDQFILLFPSCSKKMNTSYVSFFCNGWT